MKNAFVRPLALVLPALTAGFLLSGCPKNDSSADDAPYGQAAPPVAAASPSPDVPPVSGDTPPGPRMGGTPQGGTVPPGPRGAGGPMSGGAPMMGGPMMGGGDPMAPLTATPELDKAIKDAEAKKDKKAIAAAYASRGYARMTDDAAGQRIKYRKALEDFRTALASDPTNQKAKDNKAQIESIYRSMGRPVPGEEGK